MFRKALLALLFIPSIIFADTSGPNSTGNGTDDSSIGTISWSNPGNITGSDDTYATATMGTVQLSHFLSATNFSFSIPSGAIINGILVEIERKSVGAVGATIDNSVKIIKGGTPSGTDFAGETWNTGTDRVDSYGGASELWGLAWTYSDINASNFGFAISAGTSGISSDAYVDHVRITVYYTAASGGLSIQSRDWYPEDDF